MAKDQVVELEYCLHRECANLRPCIKHEEAQYCSSTNCETFGPCLRHDIICDGCGEMAAFGKFTRLQSCCHSFCDDCAKNWIIVVSVRCLKYRCEGKGMFSVQQVCDVFGRNKDFYNVQQYIRRLRIAKLCVCFTCERRRMSRGSLHLLHLCLLLALPTRLGNITSRLWQTSTIAHLLTFFLFSSRMCCFCC